MKNLIKKPLFWGFLIAIVIVIVALTQKPKPATAKAATPVK